MPATNEILLEEIRATQQALTLAQGNNDVPRVAQLTTMLETLNKRLSASQQALNESAAILKG